MSHILIHHVNAKKSRLSVWNQNESSCHMMFRPPHTMTLTVANGESDHPSYYSIEFDNRKAWFDFVKLVNATNRRVKKLPRDEWGMPMLEDSHV